MDHPLIDPSRISALIAAGFGAFLSILFQRNATKLGILTTLASAEIVSYYFAQPAWTALHASFVWADDQWKGPVALTLGLLAIFIVGGLTRMASDFFDAPWKTISDFIVSTVRRFFGKAG